jgi:futalosine hydrolase
MKKTLIVAATYQELAQTFEHFGLTEANFVEQAHFDIVITGVGMTATAFALGKHLHIEYSLVLNVGIAGSFDRSLRLGDLVIVDEDTFSELGAEDGENFIPLNQLGFGDITYRGTFASGVDLLRELPVVKGITVNTVHGHAAHINELLQYHQVQIESMEGAAVFYACSTMNIPVLQVRSISNYVEQRNRDNWKIGLAIRNLNDWLIKFLTFAS